MAASILQLPISLGSSEETGNKAVSEETHDTLSVGVLDCTTIKSESACLNHSATVDLGHYLYPLLSLFPKLGAPEKTNTRLKVMSKY